MRATGAGGTAEPAAAHELLGMTAIEKAPALPARNCRRSNPISITDTRPYIVSNGSLTYAE
jgi:hypothetical protein